MCCGCSVVRYENDDGVANHRDDDADNDDFGFVLWLWCDRIIYAFVLMPIAPNTTHVVLYFRVMAPIASILVR